MLEDTILFLPFVVIAAFVLLAVFFELISIALYREEIVLEVEATLFAGTPIDFER